MYVGKKVTRVDAYDKVIGRTKYTDDLCDKSAYIARILHSTIANGRVLSIDTSEAEKIPGVVKVFTCFDLKEKHYFPTAGHPWSTDESHQDVADRLVLTYFGSHKDPDNDRLVYDRQVNKFNRQYAKIWPAYQSNTGTNLCIVRYSDVLLMAAEALCQINNGSTPEAIGYVNAVRKRAYGQMDGRKFIDHIELTNPGENYTIDEVCVEIVDVTDNTASVTCTTEQISQGISCRRR